MYFEYQQEGIARLLGKNRNELVVPRYQRDYSWNTTQAKTLLDDIANCIHIENGKLKSSQYFFGNILLKGKPVDSDQTLEIIDGQQRITTVYILLAVIYEILKDIDDKSSATENLIELVYEKSLFTRVLNSRNVRHYISNLLIIFFLTTCSQKKKKIEKI